VEQKTTNGPFATLSKSRQSSPIQVDCQTGKMVKREEGGGRKDIW